MLKKNQYYEMKFWKKIYYFLHKQIIFLFKYYQKMTGRFLNPFVAWEGAELKNTARNNIYYYLCLM